MKSKKDISSEPENGRVFPAAYLFEPASGAPACLPQQEQASAVRTSGLSLCPPFILGRFARLSLISDGRMGATALRAERIKIALGYRGEVA